MSEQLPPSSATDGVPDDLLACLNDWPAGTRGHAEGAALIAALNALCRRHGYGRVPQLVAAIEEIWRDPEAGLARWPAWQGGGPGMPSGWN